MVSTHLWESDTLDCLLGLLDRLGLISAMQLQSHTWGKMMADAPASCDLSAKTALSTHEDPSDRPMIMARCSDVSLDRATTHLTTTAVLPSLE